MNKLKLNKIAFKLISLQTIANSAELMKRLRSHTVYGERVRVFGLVFIIKVKMIKSECHESSKDYELRHVYALNRHRLSCHLDWLIEEKICPKATQVDLE